MKTDTCLRWGALSLLLALNLQSPAAAQTAGAPPPGTLQARVLEIAGAHHGNVALFAKNLKTGETVALDPDVPVQTASVIKLAILFEAMEQVRAGGLHLSDPIVLHKDDVVGGSGILQFFNTPLTLTLHDVLLLMITQSDNTATNLAIDKVGLANIDAESGRMGLANTWLYKKIFTPATEPMPPDQKIYGLGKSTAREMATLMTRIYACQFTRPSTNSAEADRALCTDMLQLLAHQFFRGGIPRLLDRENSAVADASMGNKTGALDAVRSDVGLISTKAGPIVLALFTYRNADHGWWTDNEGEVTIAKLTEAIVSTWSPEGFDPAGYRPVPAPPAPAVPARP